MLQKKNVPLFLRFFAMFCKQYAMFILMNLRKKNPFFRSTTSSFSAKNDDFMSHVRIIFQLFVTINARNYYVTIAF